MAKFYLTTPIYYVNARPHIGHAYTTIVADVLARRHRLLGDDTFFLTGTDEHGQKIERSAAVAGISPQQLADDVSIQFRNLWDRMGLTYDRYIRTTDPKHKRGAQKLFEDLFRQGYIYLDTYTGAYCVSDEAFVDVQPGEPCPDCGRITETVTEENFFFKLSSFQRALLDLIESNTLRIENEARRNEVLSFLLGPVSTLQKGESVFVPQVTATARDIQASKTSGELVEVNQLSYTEQGTPYVAGALRDLSISRSSFKWGIPVPPSVVKSLPTVRREHVIYVWLDALANYMTAIGYGSDNAEDMVEFQKYWPADLHLVGKEIIRFHCVYWPAFLLALNPEIKLPNATKVQQHRDAFAIEADLTNRPFAIHQVWAEKWLPKSITAHGWLLFDNSKMSKSKGNIVRTETILDGFGDHVYGNQFPDSTKAERDLFAADVLRYFLLREIPFGQDGSFSFEALITRYNADLANGYGNLVSRTLSMIARRDGEIPPNDKVAAYDPNFMANDVLPYNAMMAQANEASVDVAELSFSSALAKIWSMIARIDGYMNQYAPWKLVSSDDKVDQYKAEFILYSAADAIRIITALLYPVLPVVTAKVWAQLGLGDIELAARNGDLNNLQWGGLKPGTKLGVLAPIFPRADKGLVQIMTDMENPEAGSSKLEAESANPRPEAPLKSAATPAPAQPVPDDPTHPAAPPRTSTIEEPAAGTLVGGSAAITTERPPATSHTEATPSGVFASVASQVPVSADDTAAAQQAPQITIDDFAKIELRVAEIKVAERIPKADKLLRLEVDLGYEKRQILSGIAEWYTPEELIGRRIVVITNLAPRKMRGLESHGMLLAASHGEGGKPVLATFREEIALGSRLK